MKYALFSLVLLIACEQQTAPDQVENDIDEASTKQVLDHHLQAFMNNDIEETMKDYTDESVLITPDATYTGLEEIRSNFENAFKIFPKDSIKMSLDKSVVSKDVAYIIWKSDGPQVDVTYGTDTFIIRNGKILRQTFAGVFGGN